MNTRIQIHNDVSHSEKILNEYNVIKKVKLKKNEKYTHYILIRVALGIVLVLLSIFFIPWNLSGGDYFFLFIGLGIVYKIFTIFIFPVIINSYVRNQSKPEIGYLDFEQANQDSLYLKKVTPGLLLGESDSLEIVNQDKGIFVSGGAGSGKTASIFNQLTFQLGIKGYSGIIYDLKYPKLTNQYMQAHGIAEKKVSVKIIAFSDYKNSHRINIIPPSITKDKANCIEITEALFTTGSAKSKDNDFWILGAKNIFSTAVYFLAKNDPENCNFPYLLLMLLHDNKAKIIEKICTDNECRLMLASINSLTANEKTLGDIFATLQNFLSPYIAENLFYILSGKDENFFLNDLKNPTMLIIGSEASKMNAYSPIISLICSIALKQMNVPNQNRSVLLLDEAPTINIPNIEQIPATGRSNKISVIYGVQDVSQMILALGKEKTEVIINNLGTKYFGYTTNMETAEKVSKYFGKEDVLYRTRSESNTVGSSSGSSYGGSGENFHSSVSKNRSFSKTTGWSESYQEREIMQARELSNLKSGQFICVSENYKGIVNLNYLEPDNDDYYSRVMTETFDTSFSYTQMIEGGKYIYEIDASVKESNYSENQKE